MWHIILTFGLIGAIGIIFSTVGLICYAYFKRQSGNLILVSTRLSGSEYQKKALEQQVKSQIYDDRQGKSWLIVLLGLGLIAIALAGSICTTHFYMVLSR